MARALRLAARGLNTTTPNPRVGCVIARDSAVLGEGWHERAGGPHAEVVAMRSAGAHARGATAYVTLEPCSHHGRTPPCADALIAAGLGRVVIAMEDPNPLVCGQGVRALRQAGITTQVGLMAVEAVELNVGFVSRMTRGRPWVRVKIASSLDGKTALPNGASQWITGPAARRDGHRWRARSCAVMTGIGTLQDDDPRLTVRDVASERQPARIVVDSRLRIDRGARVLDGGRVIVATATHLPDKQDLLAARGAEVWCLPGDDGRVDLARLMEKLGENGFNEILVEAGINLHSALVAAGMVDELVIYMAPRLLGDAGRGMIRLPRGDEVADMPGLVIRDARRFGQDWRFVARWADD